MQLYITQVIEGIASGALYGVLGLALMFIFRSNKVFNFAQGEMATASTFFASFMLQRHNPALSVGATLVFAFLLGASVDLLILKLIRRRDELTTIIVSIGVYAIINSVDCWIFGYDPVTFPSPFPEGNTSIWGATLSYQNLGTFTCTGVIALGLYILFKHTYLGIAFQAAAEDQLAARLKGIRVSLLTTVSWGISGIVGSLAGMLVAHILFLHPNMMGAVLLYAMAAAIIGGLQSSFGALAGGIIVGLSENLSTNIPFVGSDLKTVAVYFILGVFLLIRPRGLFGRDEPRKI